MSLNIEFQSDEKAEIILLNKTKLIKVSMF